MLAKRNLGGRAIPGRWPRIGYRRRRWTPTRSGDPSFSSPRRGSTAQGRSPCLGESFLCHHKQLQGPQYGPGLKPRPSRPKTPNVPRRGSSARSWGSSLSLLDDEDVTNLLVDPNLPIASTHSRHIIGIGRVVDIRPRVDPNILQIMEQLLLWSWAMGVALANPMHSRPDLWSRQVDGAVSENVFLRRAYHSCQYLYLSVLASILTSHRTDTWAGTAAVLNGRVYIDGGEFSYSSSSGATYQYCKLSLVSWPHLLCSTLQTGTRGVHF